MSKAKEIELGDMIEDAVTALRGVCISRGDFAFAGPQLTAQPHASKDGTVPNQYTADAARWKLVRKCAAAGASPAPHSIQNGDKVRHKITGLEGIVTSITRWLHGCDVVGVAPMVEKDGKPAERFAANVNELEIVAKQFLPLTPSVTPPAAPPRRTGGPADMPKLSRL